MPTEQPNQNKPKFHDPKSMALFSLLGYPGAGHFVSGLYLRGSLFAVPFTVTLVIFLVVALSGIYNMFGNLYSLQGEQEIGPELVRIFAWGLASFVLYIGAAIDVYVVCSKLAAEQTQQKLLVEVSSGKMPSAETEQGNCHQAE